MSGVFIAIEGPTGVGKTTLAGRLAVALGASVALDPFEDNPFLPRLRSTRRPDPDRALALQVELTFLGLRIAQLRQIVGILDVGRSMVADWALLKQPIFAATTLDAADTGRIAATVALWARSVPRPDILIGLSAPAAVIQERIRRRDRRMQACLSIAEIGALGAAFEAAYAAWDRPLIRLDAATFNTFNNDHVHELAARVRQLPIPVEMR